MKMKLTVLIIFLATICTRFSHASGLNLYVVEMEDFPKDRICHVLSYDKLLAKRSAYIPLLSPIHNEALKLYIQARRYDKLAYFTFHLESVDAGITGTMYVNTSYASYEHIDMFHTSFYLKVALKENNEERDAYRRISIQLGQENICETLKNKTIFHDLN